MKLLALALAPGLFLLLFVYLTDKYEREPLKEVLKAFFIGAIFGILLLTFYLLTGINSLRETINNFSQAIKVAFIEAGLPEETIKFIAFMLFFFRNKEFNEWFDGIVYASAISLGFATIENILYVAYSGINTGIYRAFFAVPAHFIMGTTQGFFFSIAKFSKTKLINISLALISAIFIHSIYDALLFTNAKGYLFIFIVYFIGIIWLAKKQFAHHIKKSQFKS